MKATLLCYLYLFFGTSLCDVAQGTADLTETVGLPEQELSCDSTTWILDAEQMSDYQQDGFIVMRGILGEDLVNRLSEAGAAVAKIGQKFPAYFSVVERGMIFDSGLERDATMAFRETALYSSIPKIAAQLMELDARTQSLRVLR